MNREVLAAVGRATGSAVAGARPVSGGDINRALRVDLADGRTLFVKHRDGLPGDVYTKEAEGLRWLADAGALRVPEVVAVGEAPPAFLALEWIESVGPGTRHDERLGRGLAALHSAGAPAFGLRCDNWIATLPQRNAECTTWAEFYAERRLKPLAERAVEDRRLPEATLSQVETLGRRLPDLCGAPEPVSRLHGDLWGGNAMCGPSGEPVLVDPAVYGGHREMDLAMMQLFGGFSSRVFDAYDEAFPRQGGHEDRVKLYQLYPLLVHVLLFGGSYAGQFTRAIRRYVP